MQCQKLKTYMETGRVVFLPVGHIRPDPDQPRKSFREDSLQELAQSIRRHGILQPLSVRRVDGCYQLVSGERRLRAAVAAGVDDVPCIIMNMNDKESALSALVENLQRQDLDFVEEARGIARLLRVWGMSQEQAAGMLGKSQSAVANKLRILRHSEEVLQALLAAELTERHARALLKLRGDGDKLTAIRTIAAQKLSVAQAERYIDSLCITSQQRKSTLNVGTFLRNLTDSLDRIQRSGIPAISERRETDSQIVLTITIPKLP